MFLICSALLLCLSHFASAQTPVTSCGTVPVPSYVDIGGCLSQPCQFSRGTTIYSTVSYTYPGTYSNPYIEIKLFNTIPRFLIYSGTVSYCNYTECPIKEGDTFVSNETIPIPSTIPRGTYTFRFSLWGTSSVQLFCYEITVKIV